MIVVRYLWHMQFWARNAIAETLFGVAEQVDTRVVLPLQRLQERRDAR